MAVPNMRASKNKNIDFIIQFASSEELQLSYLDFNANSYRKFLNKGYLPISAKTLRALREKLFGQILANEVCEEFADVAQQILSALAKSLARKRITVEGRKIIKAEEAQEKALKRLGFSFWPGYGDYVKALDRQQKHRLHIFLSEDGNPTATLIHKEGLLDFDQELGRWPLSNLHEGLVQVVAEAKKQVANLLA